MEEFKVRLDDLDKIILRLAQLNEREAEMDLTIARRLVALEEKVDFLYDRYLDQLT